MNQWINQQANIVLNMYTLVSIIWYRVKFIVVCVSIIWDFDEKMIVCCWSEKKKGKRGTVRIEERFHDHHQLYYVLFKQVNSIIIIAEEERRERERE